MRPISESERSMFVEEAETGVDDTADLVHNGGQNLVGCDLVRMGLQRAFEAAPPCESQFGIHVDNRHTRLDCMLEVFLRTCSSARAASRACGTIES